MTLFARRHLHTMTDTTLSLSLHFRISSAGPASDKAKPRCPIAESNGFRPDNDSQCVNSRARFGQTPFTRRPTKRAASSKKCREQPPAMEQDAAKDTHKCSGRCSRRSVFCREKSGSGACRTCRLDARQNEARKRNEAKCPVVVKLTL